MKETLAPTLLRGFFVEVAGGASRSAPACPGFIRVIKRHGELGKPGKRRSGKLVDNSRYPGHVLREIRAGRVVNGHSNAQEGARRRPRV